MRIRSVRGGKWIRERSQKGLSMIPHLFTLANLAFGVFAIVFAGDGQYMKAAWMIVGSLIADGLDGRMARWLKADGEFGKQMDSLADVVSFGTAPALIVYEMTLRDTLGPYGLALAAVFPMCGALRLARFNIVKTSGFFMGLPITAAGSILGTLVLYAHVLGAPLPPNLTAGLMLLLAYLMVSTIPYPDFKKPKRPEAKGLLRYSVLLVAAVYVITRQPEAAIIVPLLFYALIGPYLYVLKLLGHLANPRLNRQ